MTGAKSVSRGQMAIYSGGFAPQSGRGFVSTAKKGVSKAKSANKYAKGNKLVSKGSALADQFGLTSLLDAKTSGLFSKGVKAGKSRGYGKGKKKATMKKRVVAHRRSHM